MPEATIDRREQRHQRTRQDILDAAWRLAERDGVAALSLREVAREVGMRAPSLYTYFDGKGAIYDAMFAQGFARFDAMYDSLDLDPGDLEKSLTDAAVRFLEFCAESVARYQLMFTRAVPDWHPSEEAYAVSVTSYRRMEQALSGIGITGQRTLDLWTGVLSGLAAQQLANDPGGDRWIRLAPDAVRMLLTHLRA